MLFKIPSLILRQLYNYNSLKNTDTGIKFALKNRLTDAKIVGFHGIKVNGKAISNSKVNLDFGHGSINPEQLTVSNAVDFPLRQIVDIYVDGDNLEPGKHELEISFQSESHGKMSFTVEDGLSDSKDERPKIPMDRDDNYSKDIIDKRFKFIEDYSGVKPQHISKYGIDPSVTNGNVENFSGPANPIGI